MFPLHAVEERTWVGALIVTAPASRIVAMDMKANPVEKSLMTISKSLQKRTSRDILLECATLGLLPRPS